MARRKPSARRGRTPDGEARGAILAATERLLAGRPLHELSVTDVARESGVSRASFYFYFASKPAVLATLAEAVCEELVGIWQPWFDGEGAVGDAAVLRGNLEASVRLWSQHRSVLTATVESWRHDPEVGAMWESMMSRLADRTRLRIERDRAAGHATGGGDAAALASALTWATERAMYVGLAGIAPALQDTDALVDALVALWSRALDR